MTSDTQLALEMPDFISRPLASCPNCGSEHLDPVVEGADVDPAVHLFCQDCAHCWNVALGSYWRVTPRTCMHCPEYERCEAAYAAEHQNK